MINDQRVKFVDSSTLLKGKEVKELGIDKKNTIIWQQMPLRYFLDLLYYKRLAFKQVSQFDAKDERKLTHYQECYIYKNDPKKDIIQKFLSDFEKIVYISCWWRKSSNLNDTEFMQYAGKDGVAIGVELKVMEKFLQDYKINGLKANEQVFGGEAIYKKTGNNVKLFDEHEAIGPIFMKSCNHETDNEFRLICIKDSFWKFDVKGMRLENNLPEILYIKFREITDLIKYVVIKNDDAQFEKTLKNIVGGYGLKLRKSRRMMDGFTVFNLEKAV